MAPEPEVPHALPSDAELQELGRRLAEVVHDLRNPLASILALSDVLQKERGPEGPEIARRIHYNARICRELVDDVLFFVNERRPRREPLDLTVLVEAALEARPPRRPDIRVRAAVREPIPPIAARSADLRRLLMNLLRNAEDAMTDAGRSGDVVVGIGSAERHGERHAELSVSDEGPGFPDDLLEASQAGEPLPDSGFGLAICSRIVREHDGELEIQNRREGATVRCFFPLRALADEPTGSRPRMAARATPAHVTRPLPPLRILAVDDSKNTLDTYARVLGMDGHEVVCEALGAAGLERLLAERFDAVLVDVRLPDLPGPIFYERVGKRRPEMLESLIFATGDASNEATRDFLNATGNPYLVKPFVIDELRAALELAVAARRPEKQP